MFKKCKNGFTLVEVIISMAIMVMVMATLYSMFFSNYKTMNTVNAGVELQSQGEQAMNYIVNAAISAKSINSITYKDGTKIDSSVIEDDNTKIYRSISKEINEISFNNVKVNKATKVVNHYNVDKIILKSDSDIPPPEYLYKMYMGEKDNEVLVASFISSIKVKMFPQKTDKAGKDEGISLKEITGIEFTITLRKSESGKTKNMMEKTITNRVEFRNKN